MDKIVLVLFISILFACILTNIPIWLALLAGYILFAVYAFIKGFKIKDVLSMSAKGLKTTKSILFVFVLIGILTALWRAAGVIPAIVSYSMKIIRPEIFVPATFVLCCAMSVLTGTAFGTAATMGAVCVTIGHVVGVNPVMIGGAVLSGAYFGDRCSPVSTTASLVAGITGTDLYTNIKNMLKSAAVPFVAVCVIYAIYSVCANTTDTPVPDVYSVFARVFVMNPCMLLPAAAILVLALCKIKTWITMLVSIVISIVICVVYQGLSAAEILEFAVLGFKTTDEAISSLINGGGIVSMLNVIAIVCISSCYSGIFEQTGLLKEIKSIVENAGNRFSVYPVMAAVSAITAMVVCNQTFCIMLTDQLCGHIEKDKEKRALYLEDSAVIIPPLIPWTVACSVTLTSAGAPMHSGIAAFFLMLLPVYNFVLSLIKK